MDVGLHGFECRATLRIGIRTAELHHREADDLAAPLASAHRFQREIPGAELEVLEGTGHCVVEDAPERYAQALAGVLRRGSGTAA
jgi:pimeloyl-ACP methyl ester carboxylesterase